MTVGPYEVALLDADDILAHGDDGAGAREPEHDREGALDRPLAARDQRVPVADLGAVHADEHVVFLDLGYWQLLEREKRTVAPHLAEAFDRPAGHLLLQRRALAPARARRTHGRLLSCSSLARSTRT